MEIRKKLTVTRREVGMAGVGGSDGVKMETVLQQQVKKCENKQINK